MLPDTYTHMSSFNGTTGTVTATSIPTPGGISVETISPVEVYWTGVVPLGHADTSWQEITGSSVITAVPQLPTLQQIVNPSPSHIELLSVKSRQMTPKSDEQFYNKPLASVIGFKNGKKDGEVGLEIECEGTNLFRAPFAYWSCHDDGSLRATGEHPACEYVLKEPLDKDVLHDALEYLNQKLKESGSEVIQSQRTSVHVHVNCQKLTIRELYLYLCLYLIFEEVLVEWSGPDRAGNLFCLRAKDSDYYVNMLESVLKNKNFKQWRDDYRYSACNVASIPKFGSLEFRSMKGTVDINTIETWVSVLLHLKEKSLEYSSPIEIVEDFISIGPLPFFKKIFKDKYKGLFENTPGLSGKLWDGLRMMRDVAYSCEWKAPLAKKKRQRKPKNKIDSTSE